MERRITFFLAAAFAVGCMCLSVGLSQSPKAPGSPAPTGTRQPPNIAPGKTSRDLRTAAPKPTSIKISNFSYMQRQFYIGARSGTEWLLRMNRRDGRFVYGLQPAIKRLLPEDNFVHQAATVYTLARAARFFQDEKKTAVARQAVLTLLLATEKDEEKPSIRRPVLARPEESPLAAAGWLVAAIHELPSPGADLLHKAEELCQFIRSNQRADGSFGKSASLPKKRTAAEGNRQAKNAGPALFALMRSLQHRQADWKMAAVGKAMKFYRPWWRTNKKMEMVPWHSAAYAEAFVRGKERAFADCVNEMNDWICTLQYKKLAPQHVSWVGGFRRTGDNRFSISEPDIHSVVFMEGLVQACRVARLRGDLPRFRKYGKALEECGKFALKLQYTSANTQHFADWFQPHLLGAFHASHRDGNLRIDYTQQAVNGLVGYLAEVAQAN